MAKTTLTKREMKMIMMVSFLVMVGLLYYYMRIGLLTWDNLVTELKFEILWFLLGTWLTYGVIWIAKKLW